MSGSNLCPDCSTEVVSSCSSCSLLEMLNPQALNPDPDAHDAVVRLRRHLWFSYRVQIKFKKIFYLLENMKMKACSFIGCYSCKHCSWCYFDLSFHLDVSGFSPRPLPEWDSGARYLPSRAVDQCEWHRHRRRPLLGKQEYALSLSSGSLTC